MQAEELISLTIETTGRAGGVGLGCGDKLIGQVEFDASARQAEQLVVHLHDLLAAASRRPAEVRHVYVATGPGSFTGTRIGVTVARTFCQAIGGVRCVAVPTASALAEQAADLRWQHLAVVLAAKAETIYAALFDRLGDRIVPSGQPRLVTTEEFLADSPRPLALIGEALLHQKIEADGVAALAGADDPIHRPSVEGVFKAGRALAKGGHFTEVEELRPIYARRPEAVLLWELRHGGQ